MCTYHCVLLEKIVLRIWIRWILIILASWIRIQIQGAKYRPKTTKKNLLFSNPESELLKKRLSKMSLPLKGSESSNEKNLKIPPCEKNQ